MENAGERLLDYAAPRKRLALWARVSLAGGVLGASLLAIGSIWTDCTTRIACDAAPSFSQSTYGGVLSYFEVTHTGTPLGISTTYTTHWGYVAICLALSLAIVAAAALITRRLLRR